MFEANVEMQPHNAQEVDLLFWLFLEKRVESEVRFYQNRIWENNFNSNLTFTLSSVFMTASSLMFTLAGITASTSLALPGILLAAVALVLAAFRVLYRWDSQSLIYQDALLELERAKLVIPDTDVIATANLSAIYPQLVTSIENVIRAEANQWGQVRTLKTDESLRDVASDPLSRLIASANLTPGQMEAIRSVVSAGSSSPAPRVTSVKISGESDYQAPMSDYGESSPG